MSNSQNPSPKNTKTSACCGTCECGNCSCGCQKNAAAANNATANVTAVNPPPTGNHDTVSLPKVGETKNHFAGSLDLDHTLHWVDRCRLAHYHARSLNRACRRAARRSTRKRDHGQRTPGQAVNQQHTESCPMLLMPRLSQTPGMPYCPARRLAMSSIRCEQRYGSRNHHRQ